MSQSVSSYKLDVVVDSKGRNMVSLESRYEAPVIDFMRWYGVNSLEGVMESIIDEPDGIWDKCLGALGIDDPSVCDGYGIWKSEVTSEGVLILTNYLKYCIGD